MYCLSSLPPKRRAENMIALKAINTASAPTRHALFHPRRPNNPKSSILRLCKLNDSDPDLEGSPPQGDKQKQELLAQIAILQAQKVRLTDYLDERSAYLTQFAEEANAEFDKVGEDGLRELDEASARITQNIETQMQAFEETAEMNRTEIERNEIKLATFEGQIVKERNEGMFFKNLGQKAQVEKAKADEATEKIKAGSKIRKHIYLTLIGLLAVSIATLSSLLHPTGEK